MLKAQLSLSLLLGCLMVGPATLGAHAHALPPPRSVMTDATADDTVPRLSAETERRLLEKIGRLPVYTAHAAERTPFDWLIEPERSTAAVYRTPDGKGVVLANAMVARTLRVVPNLSTVSLINRMTGEEMLRAASSEGYVSLDGARWSLGGLAGQPERGYLDLAWLDAMEPLPQSFLIEDFEVRKAKPTMEWARRRWALQTEDATGREVVFTLHGSGVQRNVTAELHFVIYDQVPALRKWLTLTNGGNEALTVDSFSLEQLAFAQPETRVSNHFDRLTMPNLHVESDYACARAFTEPETDLTEHWTTDPAYTSQVNYSLRQPCVLEVRPPLGPDLHVAPGGTFESFNVYEMPFDSDDRERKGLFCRRFYRAVAPWTTESPILMHVTSSDPTVVRRAIDQCRQVGYEMVILSFGSGADAENVSEENIRKFSELADYARSQGVELGCYSLLASRWIDDSTDVINPMTGKRGGMTFGSSPCLGSRWADRYFDKVRTFLKRTGISCLEHDGSYPGDPCASTRHPGHRGLGDSQWNQFHRIATFYRELRAEGLFLNVPDFYFLNGSNKVGIGYREANWSLPRDRQIVHTRQINYDGTWDRMASMTWSFVPLVEYHGGGAAATIEPLSEHLAEYERLMFQNYSAGVQACYRGPRLYDTPETERTVRRVIDWYKRYRRLLNSDLIHLRRVDLKDWDGYLHVDPKGKEKAMAVLFNPTDEPMKRTLRLPLYYTGLREKARIRREEGKAQTYRLDRDYSVELEVEIPAGGYTWYVVE